MATHQRESIREFNGSASGAGSKSLELLFEYTKFHIGIYLTMTSIYVGLATLTVNNKLALHINQYLLWIAIVFTMLAGLAGGVIVSSITQINSNKTSEFLECSIGPWDWKRLHFHALKWTYIEHSSFWVGLICAVFSFIFVQPNITNQL